MKTKPMEIVGPEQEEFASEFEMQGSSKSGEEAQLEGLGEALEDLRAVVNNQANSDISFAVAIEKSVQAYWMLLIGQSDVLKKMLSNGTVEYSYDDKELLFRARIYKKDVLEIDSGCYLLSLSLFT